MPKPTARLPKKTAVAAKRKRVNGLVNESVRRLPKQNRMAAKGCQTSMAASGSLPMTVMAAFVSHLNDLVGSVELAFSVCSAAYADLAPKEGWPPLSDKVLLKAMTAAGCKRKQADERNRGRGRYLKMIIPEIKPYDDTPPA